MKRFLLLVVTLLLVPTLVKADELNLDDLTKEFIDISDTFYEYYDVVQSAEYVSEVIEEETYVLDEKIQAIYIDLDLLEMYDFEQYDERLEILEEEIELFVRRLKLYEDTLHDIGAIEEEEEEYLYIDEDESLDMVYAFAESKSSRETIKMFLVDGAGYSEEQADEALDNANIDFNEHALFTLRELAEGDIYSENFLREMLIDVYMFTEEEADYAIDNLD